MSLQQQADSTLEERLAIAKAEADRLQRALDEKNAQERPAALGAILDLIATHRFTRKEIDSPTWRKRPFKARGPRKPKLVEQKAA